MSESIIQCVAYADGRRAAAEGLYLKSYDPDANEGKGRIVWTASLGEAARFATAADAWVCWRQQSTVRPTRPWDGRPNRPATQFSVIITPAEEAERHAQAAHN